MFLRCCLILRHPLTHCLHLRSHYCCPLRHSSHPRYCQKSRRNRFNCRNHRLLNCPDPNCQTNRFQSCYPTQLYF